MPVPLPLTLLIGLPGSGKSTWAKQTAAQHSQQIVSTDAIRETLFGDESIQGDWNLIWQEAQRQLCQSLLAMQQGTIAGTIYDATNVRRRSRRQLLRQLRSIGFTPIIGLWIDTPLALCLKRNQDRSRRAAGNGARSRQVPPDVILRMHRQLTGAPPSLEEGFDRLIRRIANIAITDVCEQNGVQGH